MKTKVYETNNVSEEIPAVYSQKLANFYWLKGQVGQAIEKYSADKGNGLLIHWIAQTLNDALPEGVSLAPIITLPEEGLFNFKLLTPLQKIVLLNVLFFTGFLLGALLF